MKQYSFEKIDNIFVLGDCHGDFKNFLHSIKERLYIKDDDKEMPHPKEAEFMARIEARRNMHNEGQIGRHGHGLRLEMPQTIWEKVKESPKKKSVKVFPYSNSIFIFTGDCGIGFNKPKYYTDLFEKYNNILSYNNSFVIFVRGNHDDPSYFDGETINLSNIKAVPDYSVISARDHNILCVGGAISIDRTWRKKQEDRINMFSSDNKKKLYWDGEAPVFKEDSLKEITEKVIIDIVVSHSSPSFATPENHGFIDNWASEDEKLKSDIKNERIIFDKIFNTLRSLNSQPKYWAYGHFDIMYIEKRSDTIFRAINSTFTPINIDLDIFEFSTMMLRRKTIKKEPIEIEHPQIDWNENVLRVANVEAIHHIDEQENRRDDDNDFGNFIDEIEENADAPVDEEIANAPVENVNRRNLRDFVVPFGNVAAINEFHMDELNEFRANYQTVTANDIYPIIRGVQNE